MTRAPTNHVIEDGVSHFSHPHHRNTSRSKLKSQWTITEPQEVASFRSAHESGWLDSGKGWGLHRPNESIGRLGTAIDGQTALYIAKFVSMNAKPWHGYPADHKRRLADVPSERHLREWMDQGLVSNAAARKLVKQQPCNL